MDGELNERLKDPSYASEVELAGCKMERDDLKEEVRLLTLQIREIYGTLDSVIHAADVEQAARTWIPVLMEQLRPVVLKRKDGFTPLVD